MKKRKLVLWDIDGTLLRCGKAPRGAILKAMAEVFGVQEIDEKYSFSGKTDPQIIYELMSIAQMDVKLIEEKLPLAIDKYVTQLGETLQSEDIAVLSGALDILRCLRSEENIIQGLLTGNVIEGARIKLNRAGLSEYFFGNPECPGAFGSDSRHRSDLPAVAIRRALERTGHVFSEKDIVIIGDSPSDVLCGKSHNVKSIAVATGWHSVDDLQQYEPDYAVENLLDTQTLLRWIL